MSARTGALIARHLRAGSGAAVVIALVVALLAAIADAARSAPWQIRYWRMLPRPRLDGKPG